jgi:hypothetical protein
LSSAWLIINPRFAPHPELVRSARNASLTSGSARPLRGRLSAALLEGPFLHNF